MNFRLDNKVSLVTGGTKGIGKAICMALARAGSKVILTSRHGDEAEKVAAQVEELGVPALGIEADVSKLGDIDRLVSEAVERFGPINVLVNNAGVGITRFALDVSEKEWDEVLGINLKGLFFCSQAVARVMVRQGGGKIINIASAMGLVADRGLSPYCASKGGVVQLTKALALEWARYNIQVNAVAPGYVKTPMNEYRLNDEKVYQSIINRTPARRLGTEDEVAAAVLYLASPMADFVTGHVLCVDGGWVAQ